MAQSRDAMALVDEAADDTAYFISLLHYKDAALRVAAFTALTALG
jgi:hypothetical protein